MNIHDGKIGLTRDELEGLRTQGFTINEHTPYYMNGITVSYGDTTIGLHNWLDGLDAYIGDDVVVIRTEEQARAFLTMMSGMINLQKLLAETDELKFEAEVDGVTILTVDS